MTLPSLWGHFWRVRVALGHFEATLWHKAVTLGHFMVIWVSLRMAELMTAIVVVKVSFNPFWNL